MKLHEVSTKMGLITHQIVHVLMYDCMRFPLKWGPHHTPNSACLNV